jgi:hypothetical protein
MMSMEIPRQMQPAFDLAVLPVQGKLTATGRK